MTENEELERRRLLELEVGLIVKRMATIESLSRFINFLANLSLIFSVASIASDLMGRYMLPFVFFWLSVFLAVTFLGAAVVRGFMNIDIMYRINACLDEAERLAATELSDKAAQLAEETKSV